MTVTRIKAAGATSTNVAHVGTVSDVRHFGGSLRAVELLCTLLGIQNRLDRLRLRHGASAMVGG